MRWEWKFRRHGEVRAEVKLCINLSYSLFLCFTFESLSTVKKTSNQNEKKGPRVVSCIGVGYS